MFTDECIRLMQDQKQIAAMMELLGDKQKKPAPVEMSPGLIDLIHQETLAPQQNIQVAANVPTESNPLNPLIGGSRVPSGGVVGGVSGVTEATAPYQTPYQMKFRLNQLLRDKAATKSSGGDVGQDYSFYNTQIRMLRDALKGTE